MKPRHLWLFTMGWLVLGGWGCKPKETVPPSLTTIKFELMAIANDTFMPSGAKIYLFTTQADYAASYAALKPINALDSTVSAEGKATVNVDPTKNYYLMVMYKDENRKFTFINDTIYSNVISDLPRNTDITVRVPLFATDGLLAFWTSSPSALPITIQLNGQEYVLDRVNTNPNLNVLNPDILLVNRRAGVYKFYAKTDKGCVWTGEAVLGRSRVISIEYGPCKVGKLIFWTTNVNVSRLPITVVLNNDDTIGSVNNTTPNYTCGGSEANTLSLYKEVGSYTYLATSADNQCIWTGRIAVSEDGCTNIHLKECK